MVQELINRAESQLVGNTELIEHLACKASAAVPPERDVSSTFTDTMSQWRSTLR